MTDASGLNAITAAEHIGTNATGDNIEAKRVANYVWDGANWQRETQPGGGGGGASTIADGADVAEGATTDAAVTAGSAGSVSGKLRQISSDISAIKTSVGSGNNGTTDAGTQRVTLSSDSTGQVKLTSNTGVDIGKLTANQSVNVAQINGNTTTTVANGTQTVGLTDGTNVANTLKSDGTAAGQNSQLVAPGYLSINFTTTSAQAVATTDAGNYKYFSMQNTTVGTNAVHTIQFSNDNANWTAGAMMIATATTGSNASATGNVANTLYHGPILGRYIRINVTAISAGTSAGVLVLHTMPTALISTDARVQGAITNNNAAPGASNFGVVGAVANAAQQTWTEGNLVLASSDLKGNTRMRLSDAAGNDRGANVNAVNELLVIDQGFRPAATALNTYSVRVTTNTTTTPTASLAYISSIVVTVETAGTTSTLDIRDKSGTPIYLVRTLSTAALLGNGDLVYNFQTPIKMTGGIDVITGGSVAATVGVFINYYQ